MDKYIATSPKSVLSDRRASYSTDAIEGEFHRENRSMEGWETGSFRCYDVGAAVRGTNHVTGLERDQLRILNYFYGGLVQWYVLITSHSFLDATVTPPLRE
jgi:hypothetical protein